MRSRGSFFENEARQRFQVLQVLRNVFSQLVLMVPAGTYQLLVKSKLKIQLLRTGEPGHPLEVGESQDVI